jgi:hypothetical protein
MSERIPIGFWVALIAVQCILSFGLIGFWTTERSNAQDSFSNAAERTVELQLAALSDPAAKGIIAGLQVKIQSLMQARNSGYVFVGYMAMLSVCSLVLTGILLTMSWRARKGQARMGPAKDQPGIDRPEPGGSDHE